MSIGGVLIAVKDLWTLLAALVVLMMVFSLFRFTKVGLAMRASAIDLEAAAAQGVSPTRMSALAWAVAVTVATVAGIMAAAGASQVQPALGYLALAAFPAIILGGIESPGGAVLGGLIIGVLQQIVAGYEHQYLSWAGANVNVIAPYLVMIVILLIRPQGLFGAVEVRRI